MLRSDRLGDTDELFSDSPLPFSRRTAAGNRQTPPIGVFIDPPEHIPDAVVATAAPAAPVSASCCRAKSVKLAITSSRSDAVDGGDDVVDDAADVDDADVQLDDIDELCALLTRNGAAAARIAAAGTAGNVKTLSLAVALFGGVVAQQRSIKSDSRANEASKRFRAAWPELFVSDESEDSSDGSVMAMVGMLSIVSLELLAVVDVVVVGDAVGVRCSGDLSSDVCIGFVFVVFAGGVILCDVVSSMIVSKVMSFCG